MLDSPLSIDYDGATKTLALVSRTGRKSVYTGEETDGSATYIVTVDHTIPPRGGSGESHLIRLDVEHYDTSGIYVRTSSAWVVLKTQDAPQQTSDSTDAASCLTQFLGQAGIVSKVLNGES